MADESQQVSQNEIEELLRQRAKGNRPQPLRRPQRRKPRPRHLPPLRLLRPPRRLATVRR
ncbi:MAG: hypothetical protein QM775_04805 [Pirellulales bacterium]